MIRIELKKKFSGLRFLNFGFVPLKRIFVGAVFFGVFIAADGIPVLQGASLESREQALYEEGMALNELRRFDDALVRFKKAVALDLENHKYHNAIFITYMSTRQGLKGISFYEDLRKDHPKSATVRYWLGRFYLQRGSLEEAATAFEESAGLGPEDEHPWISLGHVQLRLGKHDEALKAYRQAEALVPGIPVVRAGIGKIYFHQKEYEKARVEYEKALEKDPGLMEARFELSLIYEKQGEFGKAISEWKSILKSDPNDLRAREKLARTYFRGEQYADAVNEFSLLSRLLPNDPKVYLGLGEAQVMLASTVGNPGDRAQLMADAAESFQHTLDFDPDNEAAKAYLTRLSEK